MILPEVLNIASDRRWGRCGRFSLGHSVAHLGIFQQGYAPLHHHFYFFHLPNFLGRVHPDFCASCLLSRPCVFCPVVEDIYTSSRHHPEMTHLQQRKMKRNVFPEESACPCIYLWARDLMPKCTWPPHIPEPLLYKLSLDCFLIIFIHPRVNLLNVCSILDQR